MGCHALFRNLPTPGIEPISVAWSKSYRGQRGCRVRRATESKALYCGSRPARTSHWGLSFHYARAWANSYCTKPRRFWGLSVSTARDTLTNMGQLGLAWMENNWSCPWQLQLWLFLRYFVQTHLCLEKLTPGTSWSWKVIWEYNFIHIRVIPVSLNLSQLSLFPPSLPSLSYPTFPLSPITITTILSLSLSHTHTHTHTHTFFPRSWSWKKGNTKGKSTNFRPHTHHQLFQTLQYSAVSTNFVTCLLSFVPSLNLWKHFPFHSDNWRLNKTRKVLEIPQLNMYSKNNMVLPNNINQDLSSFFHYITNYGKSVS